MALVLFIQMSLSLKIYIPLKYSGVFKTINWIVITVYKVSEWGNINLNFYNLAI